MRIAVFSDIHGNMDAFQKVLEDVDRSHADAVFSLGDNIGYGSEPEQVIQTLRRRGIPSVLGNHELAAQNPEFLGWFNPAARQSLVKTFAMLSGESLAFIQSLPRHISAHGCRFVHGFPPDSPTLYLFQVENRRKRKVLDELPNGSFSWAIPICWKSRLMARRHAVNMRFGPNLLLPDLKYLINIGAVGQPRDGDLRAKYVIWDTAASLLDIRCVPYDAQAAAAKIRAAGLPESHARRLVDRTRAHGVMRPLRSEDLFSVHPPDGQAGRILYAMKRIGKYIVRGLLGRGGMSKVYKVEIPHIGKIVALKLLDPHPLVTRLIGARKIRDLFLSEAVKLARLNHPNIVAIRDFDEADGSVFYIMDYFFSNLGQWIGETQHTEAPSRTIRLDRAIDLTRQVLAGLACLHHHGWSIGTSNPSTCSSTTRMWSRSVILALQTAGERVDARRT